MPVHELVNHIPTNASTSCTRIGAAMAKNHCKTWKPLKKFDKLKSHGDLCQQTGL